MSEFVKAWQVPHQRTVYEDAEGNLTVREGGYLNWRNKNPGNLRYRDETVSLGAIGSMKPNPNTDFESMSVFPDRQTGLNAKEKIIKKYYMNCTLAEAVEKYSPQADNEDVNISEKTRDIANKLGVSPDTKLSSLKPEEIEKFKDELKKYEGKEEPGTEYSFPAGTAENEALRKEKILHYHYAWRLPEEELAKDENYNAIFRSNDRWFEVPYGADPETRRLWEKRKKNMDILIQRASQAKIGKASQSGKTASGNVNKSSSQRRRLGDLQKPGPVKVRAYDREEGRSM